ncbi:MAG: amino acid permease [Deltaproteobacteria bacterium]|nr:amino acid permease [Deltaproteobacteria bacterium]MBW2110709.1 amino acid permease [Deltaproteobacteria bacterium]MBW2351888.1 amino acid permease [Deltaproteobacteria bacterium]HDZ90508.1 amino acid permease [Deltaproteobacteria bacterium]
MERERGKDDQGPAGGGLGTFSGVFTPSILTILGIILFMRMGYVVGSAGLLHSLIIISLANAVSVLTSISLSAIATNIRVKGGGDYYLISRTLGLEYGGAIGVVLFLAQSVSVGFYCIGFGEALSSILPPGLRVASQIIGAGAVAFLFVFAWLGADWATRLQYLVMGLLVAALFSFFAGGLVRWDRALLAANWMPPSGGGDFWILFAIFFPAVTGFTQGVSMSGDLRDPGRSLPMGTFLAVGISILIYYAVAVVFAGALPGSLMREDYAAMKRVAAFAGLIDAGVIAATLSSAMASFLGAPRILKSLAGDRIFPFLLPFSKGSGPMENPRRGVLLTAGIAFGVIALGNLNLVARVVSMFFLISYGLLNYATFFEARASSPSFRPRFRWFDTRVSLLGFLSCLALMFAIDPAAGAVAVSLLFAIYQYLKRTVRRSRWADSRRSYHLQLVREHLIAAASEPEHPRDWRPQILVLADGPGAREELLSFACLIEGGSGLTTAAALIEGTGVKMLRFQSEARERLGREISEMGIDAFPLVLFTPDLHVGIHLLVQAAGIGPLKVNTILVKWPGYLPGGILSPREQRYRTDLRVAFRLGCNIIALHSRAGAWDTFEARPGKERRIDVWWVDDSSSRLMLLLAYLVTRKDGWEDAPIHVFAMEHGEGKEESARDLRAVLEEVRVEATPEIVPEVTAAAVAKYSSEAAMVFFPFRFSGEKIVGPLGREIGTFLEQLPLVALVLAREDIDLDADPEEGAAAEMAAALDALSDTEKKAMEKEEEAKEAREDLKKKMDKARAAREAGDDQERITEIDAEVEEARDRVERVGRAAAEARAKAVNAAREVERLGGTPPEQ